MQKLICSVLFMLLGLTSVGQAVEVEQALFDGFERVQKYCKASLEYDLNEPVDEVSPRYHQQMQCLFATATKGYMNEAQAGFAQKLKDIRSDAEIPKIESEVADCETDFTAIKAAQEAQGHTSFCTASGENAAKDYSLCRVTETAFNEFCAYQEYITIKTRDEVLLRQCSESAEGSQFSERVECIADEQSKLDGDLARTLEVIEVSLEEYETLTESWSLHGWLVVLAETLENSFRRLDLARIAIDKWPLKFHDAASQKAGSLPAK